MTIEVFDAAPANRRRHNKHAIGEADPTDLVCDVPYDYREDDDRRHELDEE